MKSRTENSSRAWKLASDHHFRKATSQLMRFLVVGFVTVQIDFISYRLLVFIETEPSLSKAGSFFTGTLFAFFANKVFTFRARQISKTEPLKFLVVYATTFVVNVAVHRLVLSASVFEFQHEFAWVVATGCSTVLNFIGMKFFVFSSGSSSSQNADSLGFRSLDDSSH